MIKLRGLIPKFLVKEITDRYLLENFTRLNDFFLENTQMIGFTHVSIEFAQSESHLKIPHNLGFLPKDLIQLSLIGPGAITWHYAEFDQLNLVASVTGACTVRAYIGTHIEGTI